MSQRPCIVCGTLSTKSRCPNHRRPSWESSRQRSAAARGYDAAWRAFRADHLNREPNCQRCGQPATTVDHIKALAEGGARLDHSNAQSLCKQCHATKTGHDGQRHRIY